MKPPAKSSSSWVHIVWASFTLVALVAWSELTDLAEATRASLREMADALRSAIDAVLKEARETQSQELFERPAAQARQEAWLEVATTRVNEAVSLLAVRVGQGSKDHPQVREVFPDLAGGITTAAIEDRPRLISQAATRLAALPAAFAEKDALVTRLREAAESLGTAIAANNAARVAWTGERSDEVVAKNHLRLEMERVHGRLRALFPGSRGRVESFFRKPSRPADAEDDAAGSEAEEGETPVAPETPAPSGATPSSPQ